MNCFLDLGWEGSMRVDGDTLKVGGADGLERPIARSVVRCRMSIL